MEEEIELRQYWEVLRKRWKIIAILPLIAALTSGIISFYFIQPIFQTSTTLIVGKKSMDSGQSIEKMLDYNVLLANQQLTKTYVEIAKSRTVEENVINDLELPLTVGELNSMISVNAVKATEILEISVSNTNAELTAAIANSVAQEFSKAVIEIKKVDSVSIVDKATTPINPIKPNKKLNVLIALAVGVMAAVGLVFLLEYIKNTAKTSGEKSSDVEKFLGMPVLGIIPNYQIVNKKGKEGGISWNIH